MRFKLLQVPCAPSAAGLIRRGASLRGAGRADRRVADDREGAEMLLRQFPSCSARYPARDASAYLRVAEPLLHVAARHFPAPLGISAACSDQEDGGSRLGSS